MDKKKSLQAFLILMAVSGSASAQTTGITLFGIADAAVGQVKDGSAGSNTRVQSGSMNTSRFGLKGEEDLGGGFSAGFHFQAGVRVDTGASDAKFFGRRSTVSLLGNFGEIRLGRDYTPTSFNTFYDEFGVVGVSSVGIFTYGSGANLGSPATTVLRADNSISYFLPKGAIFGNVMYAAEESSIGNQYVGGRLGYNPGPFVVGIGYGTTDTGAGLPDFKNSNLYFNYRFGFATLHTLYDVKDWSPRKAATISIGASVPVGSAGEIKFGIARADRSGGAAGSGFGDADDSTRLGIGYEHNVSKRTRLYTNYGRVTNKGAARSSVSYTPPAGMLGGETSSGIEFGIRHSF